VMDGQTELAWHIRAMAYMLSRVKIWGPTNVYRVRVRVRVRVSDRVRVRVIE